MIELTNDELRWAEHITKLSIGSRAEGRIPQPLLDLWLKLIKEKEKRGIQ